MPRGVYKRKPKTDAPATEKTAVKTEKVVAKTAAPKVEKKARAPWGSKTKKAATPVGATGEGPKSQGQSSYGISIMELASLRNNFTGNNQNHSIVKKLDTLIERGLDSAIEASTPKAEQPAEKIEKAVEAAPAPVIEKPVEKVAKNHQPPAPTATVAQLAAPVAFNPSTPPTQS